MQNKLTQQEINDIIQWDIKNWSNVLPFWEEHFDFSPESKVLALGEREGGLSFYFAKKGCEVICSDYNPLPESTKKMHLSYGIAGSVEYIQIDMKKIDLPDESVDVVVFKSVIGALGNKDDQQIALNEIFRVLKKGGKFLFAENLEGGAIHRFLRRKFVGWGERWCYVNDAEVKQWSKDFQSYTSKSYGVLGLFGRSEKQRSFLGIIDKVLTPIVPKKWRYILFGVLTK